MIDFTFHLVYGDGRTKQQRNQTMPRKPIQFSLEQIEEASDDMGGFCTACGAEAFNIEPDARNYECESCNEKKVFGAMELVLMGLVN